METAGTAMMPNRSAAIQAIIRLRQHSRDCRCVEARALLVTVERRMVQLIDLEQQFPKGRWAAE